MYIFVNPLRKYFTFIVVGIKIKPLINTFWLYVAHSEKFFNKNKKLKVFLILRYYFIKKINKNIYMYRKIISV